MPGPISEDMFKLVKSFVGQNNQRPFILRVGPQIMFND